MRLTDINKINPLKMLLNLYKYVNNKISLIAVAFILIF